METRRIVSSEGNVFDVELELAHHFGAFNEFLVNCSPEDVLELPNINSATLEKVIDWCRHYRDIRPPEIEKPLRNADMSVVVPPWDADFIDVECERISELILAANYLDISGLLDLACAKIASLIKGKTPEEI